MEIFKDTSDYREFLQTFGAGQEELYRKYKDLKNDLNISWEKFACLKWEQIDLENKTICAPLSD